MAVEIVWWLLSVCDGSQVFMMAELVEELSSICYTYITLSIQTLKKSIWIEHLTILNHSRYDPVKLDVEFIINILLLNVKFYKCSIFISEYQFQ